MGFTSRNIACLVEGLQRRVLPISTEGCCHCDLFLSVSWRYGSESRVSVNVGKFHLTSYSLLPCHLGLKHTVNVTQGLVFMSIFLPECLISQVLAPIMISVMLVPSCIISLDVMNANVKSIEFTHRMDCIFPML